MSAPPRCELTYFDGRGLAEIIRLTLAAAEIPFTEVDLKSREQFLALKPELLFAQVPLLHIDGVQLVQTRAIVRHIARKANLLGTSDIDMARVDELYEGTRDAYMPFLAVHFEPEAAVKEKIKGSLDKYLPIFNEVLEVSGANWLVGVGLTLADLGLLELILAASDYCGPERLLAYPALKRFQSALSTDQRIIRYVQSVRKPPNSVAYVNNVREVLTSSAVDKLVAPLMK